MRKAPIQWRANKQAGKTEEKNPKINKSIKNIRKDTRAYYQDRAFKDKQYPKKVD